MKEKREEKEVQMRCEVLFCTLKFCRKIDVI